MALTADIEKAYLQISVTPSHRDFLRFLWFDDVFKDDPVIIRNRFTRVIFGATCSQFLMNAVIKLHSEKYKDFDEKFVRMISKYFYSDDLNSSMKNAEEGIEFFKKVKQRFLEGNMVLRKWRTNDENLRKYIHEQENIDEGSRKELIGDKVLGVIWKEDIDKLVFDVKVCVQNALSYPPTKRNVLRVIAGIYDPLGLIQPIIVKLKLLFQEICASNCEWDDRLCTDLKQKWEIMIKEIQNCPELVIQRAYCYDKIEDPITHVEMHGFSDASMVAFGVCVYLRFIKRSGNTSVSFVASKSQIVAKNSSKTIHRLELLGNFMLMKLIVSVTRALGTEMSINRTFLWTDSQVTLGWIRSTKKEFKVFVQNRVLAIRKNVGAENWFYCKSEVNAADAVTRNIRNSDLNT